MGDFIGKIIESQIVRWVYLVITLAIHQTYGIELLSADVGRRSTVSYLATCNSVIYSVSPMTLYTLNQKHSKDSISSYC